MSVHVRPLVGTEWCEVRRVGYMVTGSQGVLLRDGTEFVLRPGDVMDLPPGHDAWVIGDEPVVTIGWTGVKTWLGPLDSMSQRYLATIVLTDIIDSTSRAISMGDRAWSDLIATLESQTQDLIGQHRGRLVKFTGDGALASFDGAARAVRCAVALRTAAFDLDMPIRVEVHRGDRPGRRGHTRGGHKRDFADARSCRGRRDRRFSIDRGARTRQRSRPERCRRVTAAWHLGQAEFVQCDLRPFPRMEFPVGPLTRRCRF